MEVSDVLIMSVKRKTTRIYSMLKVAQKDMQNNERNVKMQANLQTSTREIYKKKTVNLILKGDQWGLVV